jgi:hypothetical protein
MKKDLKKRLIMGVCSAAFMSAQVLAYADELPKTDQTAALPLTSDEQAFADKLSASAKDAFAKMNHDQRGMAMKIASHDCKGKNSCKGQGRCKSETNSCAGQNSCAGKGGCQTPPEKAVDMASKRSGAM